MSLTYDFTGWLCTDCHLANAGYSAEEIGQSGDPETDGPLSLLEVGTILFAGIHDEEHECENRPISHVSHVGCGEEERDFDTTPCDGCASRLAGSRHAATFWHTSAPKHAHAYRADIADWWCDDCETVTDFCQQINPS
jgi:hypothetical protein